MKSQSNRPDISEMPPYRLGRHWNTILAYLIPGLEDDIGELSEEMRKFMGICELLSDDKMFGKYRWCGNGRPPPRWRLSRLKLGTKRPQNIRQWRYPIPQGGDW